MIVIGAVGRAPKGRQETKASERVRFVPVAYTRRRSGAWAPTEASR